MKYKTVLVTGGAGFIGSFLTDKLINQGYKVKILDNLQEQVHQGKNPSYLNPEAEFINADVKDYSAFEKALENVDVVFHLAARVGVGQSNYEIKSYSETNVLGMANLLDIVVNKKTNVQKIIMTASMTSYGEGNYICETEGIQKPPLRKDIQMEKEDWEIHCPECSKIMKPIGTLEDSQIHNNSIYSLTKNVQEEMLMFVGDMYKIPVVSLRCFNVYGPRQSLSNPYTGVSAIFISRLKNNHAPIVYEDGLQTRDFISVHDVVDALIISMNNEQANNKVINMGSGKKTSIKEIAEVLAILLEKNIKPQISGEFRKNDIRHCFADITKAKKLLNWAPAVSLQEGLKELISWSQNQKAVDLFDKAEKELRSKDLL